MKKILFVFGVLPLLFLVACAPSQPTQDERTDDEVMMEEGEKMMDGDMMMDEDGMMENGMMKEDGMMDEDGMMKGDMMEEGMMGGENAVRVIEVIAENWAFTPATITVKKGERVQISLKGVTGLHGYSVPDLGINQVVEAGQTVTFDLPTDKPGVYNVRCSVPCGEGHRDMTGQIIIEE